MTITRQYLLTLTVEDFDPADFKPVPFTTVAKPEAAPTKPKAKKAKKSLPKVTGARKPGRQPSGDGDMDSQVKRAAELWAQAQAEGVRGPLTFVAKSMNLSTVTASRRVSRARELGLIAA